MNLRKLVAAAVLCISASSLASDFWSQLWPGTSDDNPQQAVDIAVDTAGFSYVAIDDNDGSGSTIRVVCYNPSGTQQWVHGYAADSGAAPSGIAVYERVEDGTQHVYVYVSGHGNFTDGGRSEARLLALMLNTTRTTTTSTLGTTGANSYNLYNSGTTLSSRATSKGIALYARQLDCDVYIVGSVRHDDWSDPYDDAVIVRLGGGGLTATQVLFTDGLTSSNEEDCWNSIALDSSENVYVAGYLTKSYSGGVKKSFTVAKFSYDLGTNYYIDTISGYTSPVMETIASDVAVNAGGTSVVACGSATASGQTPQCLTYKYGVGLEAVSGEHGRALCLDPDGNIVTLAFSDDADAGMILHKYTSSLGASTAWPAAEYWAGASVGRRELQADAYNGTGWDIACRSDGTVIACGALEAQYALEAFSAEGQWLWTTKTPPIGSGQSTDGGRAIALALFGDVPLSAGELHRQASSPATESFDAFTANYSTYPFDIPPYDFYVNYGEGGWGGIYELYEDEDDECTFFNDSTSGVCEVVFYGNSPKVGPQQVVGNVRFSAGREGLIFRLYRYNYTTSSWNLKASDTAPTTETLFSFTETTSAASCVSSTGEMKLKANIAPANDEDPSQDGWVHTFDLVRWVVTA